MGEQPDPSWTDVEPLMATYRSWRVWKIEIQDVPGELGGWWLSIHKNDQATISYRHPELAERVVLTALPAVGLWIAIRRRRRR